MALRVFASAWGNATHWGSLRRLMDGLKFKGFAGLERQLSEISDALARAAAEQEEAESRRGLQKQERPSQPIDVETDALTRDTAEQEEADLRRRSEQESACLRLTIGLHARCAGVVVGTRRPRQ